MSPQKKLGTLLIASALVAVPVVATMLPAPVQVAEVDSQQVAVGQLVRLEVPGNKVEWTCLPETQDMQVYEGNKLAISFRKSGKYIVVAAAMAEGGLQLYKIEIQVGGAAPTPGNSLAEQVRDWCVAAAVDKVTASKLAANFEATADAPDRIKQTLELNKSLDLSGFAEVMGKIQAYVTKHGQSREIWVAIAEGFRAYAS